MNVLYFYSLFKITGSGKRALLDVISRRSEGSTRGQVLLNGSPLTKALFQQRCGYVTQSCTFIPGLTVAQTLHYTPTIVREMFCPHKLDRLMSIYSFQVI